MVHLSFLNTEYVCIHLLFYKGLNMVLFIDHMKNMGV